MGKLVDGVWHDVWYDTNSTDGKFVRKDSVFRNAVSTDGSTPHPAEAGRYHLYVSMACPWAHRTLIFLKLKGLEQMISVSVVEPLMLENGWELAAGEDPIQAASFVHQVYTAADPTYTGRVTVPILWDRKLNTIVNNESSEIIRMFNSEFDALGAVEGDYYPQHLRAEIDEINALVYDKINNGVYKTGFATSQNVYEEAFAELFVALDTVEQRLSEHRYLVGDQITEADWRLFTTLVRFDPVYFGHFKCNRQQIADYHNISGYLRELYQVAGIAKTVNMGHIKSHYYGSHKSINPTGIVPAGPDIDLTTPHGRDNLYLQRTRLDY